jgi:hypothetical protein
MPESSRVTPRAEGLLSENIRFALLMLWFRRTTRDPTFWLTTLRRLEYVALRWDVTGYLAKIVSARM